MNKATGKTTDLREKLAVYRRDNRAVYLKEVQGIASDYAVFGTVTKTAAALCIGKRTLERMIRDFPELKQAITSVRVLKGQT